VLDFAGALVVQEEDGEDNVRSKAEIRRAQIWRGRAHGDLGQIYWESSDYWTAIEHFKCAAYLFRAANDHSECGCVGVGGGDFCLCFYTHVCACECLSVGGCSLIPVHSTPSPTRHYLILFDSSPHTDVYHTPACMPACLPTIRTNAQSSPPVREAKGRTKLMNIYAGTRECKTPLTFQDHEQAMEEAKRRMDLPQEADTGWQEAKAFLARSGVLH